MATHLIPVCTRCDKKSCDGGIWRIIKVVRISDGKDTTADVHPDNLRNCTLRRFGTKKMYRHLAVGTVTTKRFLNWVQPSEVTSIRES